MNARHFSLALATALLAAAVAVASPRALAGSGDQITGPDSSASSGGPADCGGKPCPAPPPGGQASGPASDTTGGNEGSFADYER